jgi:hypothetical protein
MKDWIDCNQLKDSRSERVGFLLRKRKKKILLTGLFNKEGGGRK